MSGYQHCVFPLYRTYPDNPPLLIGTCFRLYDNQMYVTCAHCLKDPQGDSLQPDQIQIGFNEHASGDLEIQQIHGIPPPTPGKVITLIEHPQGQDIAVVLTDEVVGGISIHNTNDFFSGISPTCSPSHASPVGSNVRAHGYFDSLGEIKPQVRLGTVIGSENVQSTEFPRIELDIPVIVGNSPPLIA